MIYDVVIVGMGPCGIFTVLELLEKAPHLKILAIEKGKSIEERDHSKSEDATIGYGGCGAFSDFKAIYSTNKTSSWGGVLQDYIEDTGHFQFLMNKVDDTFMRYSPTQDIKSYGDNPSEIEPIQINAAKNGISMLPGKVKHFGTEVGEKIIKNIYQYMKDKLEIIHNCQVDDFEKTEDGFNVIFDKDKIVKCKNLVLAPGRSGNKWFSDIAKKHDIKLSNTHLDLGLRIEFPSWIGKNIDSKCYEPKLIIREPFTDLKTRTFCYCVSGEVCSETTRDTDKLVLVNGHSYHDAARKTNNSNFALLVSTSFSEPFNDPVEFARSIVKLTNLLGGGKVLVQRLKDVKLGRRSTAKRITEMNLQPTLKDACPGDISLCFPAKQFNALIKSLEILDRIMPGLYGDDTLLYAPEVKFYSARPTLKTNLETSIDNLFMGGDSAVSRGTVQAAMSGLVIANSILEKLK